MKTDQKFRHDASTTARKQRRIQDVIDVVDKKVKPKESTKAMQAGARKYPEPPFSGKHLTKPGRESALIDEPLYDAPFIKDRIN